jgi:V/A-type H+-transporting ATPase subunit F
VKRIVVITPDDARYGFSLSGVRQMTATRENLPRDLPELARDSEVGVILVDERLLAGLPEARIKELERRWPGVVVALPAPTRVARIEEDYALRLIRRAIGYQVRLSL